MMKYSWKNKVYTLISCILFIALWQIIAIHINNDIYLPRLEQIINEIYEILNSKNSAIVVFSSFYRTLISYILALMLSMIFGMLIMVCPFFKYLVEPINSFTKTIPTMILVIISLIWFNKEITPFVVGTVIVFPILYEGIKNNLFNIDNKIIEMTKIYEVSLEDKIKKIYMPIIKRYLMSIFVSTFSLTFKVVIAGEVYGQPKYGIGSQIQIEKINFNTPGIFAWIIIILFIWFILELLNTILKKSYR